MVCSAMEGYEETIKKFYARNESVSAPSSKPVLNYFSICGRGELARLVSAVGGVGIEDKTWAPAFEDGGWRQGYQAIGNAHGFAGTLPVLEHGDVKLFQTAAIEVYLVEISPKFASLTQAQKAKDVMYAQIKADINMFTEKLLFKMMQPEEIPPLAEKYYAMLEGLLPESGYINGLDFPTMGDLAVMVIAKGCMPFQAALAVAGWAWAGKFPKIERLAKDTAAYPAVAAFLAASEHKTLKADPFGIMPAEYHSS